VLVKPRQPLEDLDARLTQAALGAEPYLTRAEFAASYGADAADLARVKEFARQHHLKVVESSAARRTVRLAGRAADFNAAFAIQLEHSRLPDGTLFRGYAGPISLPPDLQGIIQGVFGLDDRPVARRDSG
jgi:kumamolisin